MKWCSKKKLCRKSRVELLVWERSAKIIESNYLAASGLTKSWSMLKRYLEYWQAWGVSHRSRKCAPVFQCPHGKDVIPNAQPDPAVATLFHSHPAISGQVRAWHFILLPVRVLQGVMRLFSVSIPDWTAQVSSTSPHRTCSPALLAALLFSCGCFHIVMSFLYCETCTQCSRWSCNNAKYSGRITSLVGCAAFHAPHSGFPLGCQDTLLARAEPTGISTHGFPPAELLCSHSFPVCACVRHYCIPAAAPSIVVELHSVAVCLMLTAIDSIHDGKVLV